MVFQKKGGFKGKQEIPAKQKGKKPANAASFFEQESDDSDTELSMKTPGGKTPKGKQFQGDKRVSFQIPGKNTPNKTPKNENSLVKKQPTPGKASALKEFKGLLQNSASKKNNKTTKKPAAEDEDDDDEDDDDDDDDDDGDLDLDDMLGDDDDDDDDEDDDDEEDEDSEDDEKEEKSPKKVQSSLQKGLNNAQKKQNVEKNKTPSKNVDKVTPQASAKKDKKSLVSLKKSEEDDDDEDEDEDIDMDMLLDEEDDSEDDDSEEEKPQQKKQNQTNSLQPKQIQENQTPSKKEKTPAKITQVMVSPKKTEKEKPIGYQKALDLAEERKRERDARTLFIGNLPKDIAHSELKALSSDITNVNIPQHKAKSRRHAFAFIEFINEAKAEENYKILKNQKLRGESIYIDYTGHKRQVKSPKEDNVNMNLKKLFVSSIPVDCKIDRIAALFPQSSQIQLNICPTYRTAAVNFMTEVDAAEALEKSKNAKLDGKPLTVLYSISREPKNKKRKRSKKGKQNSPAKKMKMEIKESEDDDDDDDDDDDEDE